MNVVIVGCGYVGLELAGQLAARGHTVTGVRRSDAGLAVIDALDDALRDVSALDETAPTGGERTESVAAGTVTALRADATDPGSLSALPDADAVVYTASSGGRGAEAARTVYVDGLMNVIETYADRDSGPDRLIYTSSTGVYGDHDGAWVTETTPIEPTTPKTRVLADAERVALEQTAAVGINGTVARFAGLYGPDRYRLDRYLDGPVTAGYLNMIHRDDAAGAIRWLLKTEVARDAVVTVVDDEPVEKHVFADWLADECGAPRPKKRSKAERIVEGDLSTAAERRIRTSKRCSNDRLRSLGYDLEYPTFRDGYRDAITTYRTSQR